MKKMTALTKFLPKQNKVLFFSTQNLASKQIIGSSVNFYKTLLKFIPFLLFYSYDGEFYLKIRSDWVERLLFLLKNHSLSLFQQLIDIYAVDYIERINRFEICYNLLSLHWNTRVTVTTSITNCHIISSVNKIYSNAIWYEREVYDMFGIIFYGNFDLRRILTDYGFKGHPMRKNFPLTGYYELRYEEFSNRIRQEQVNFAQGYRVFSLENSWRNTNTNAVKIN